MFLFDEISTTTGGNLPTIAELWWFLPFGYLFTILVETPVLLVGLPRPVSIMQRISCGIWLTACTYPVVILVLPVLLANETRGGYLFVAEVFAPVAECFLFWLAFRRSPLGAGDWARAMIVIVIANLASFGAGEIMNRVHWFGWF